MHFPTVLYLFLTNVLGLERILNLKYFFFIVLAPPSAGWGLDHILICRLKNDAK